MDPYESAPLVATLVEAHKPSSTPPASVAPSRARLPPLRSGSRHFDGVEEVIDAVRHLHQVDDYVVAPHKSKYEARIIMNDVLAQLVPLLQDDSFSAAELQWLNEQIGRLEYLNGVNHIEAEETSAGEKMLVKAMLKFKDNMRLYPFDMLDGYNHLGIVWSNRTQHGVAHCFLQQAQHAFLVFKKLRAEAIAALTEEERAEVARLDRLEQEALPPQQEGENAEPKPDESKQSEAEHKDAEAANATTKGEDEEHKASSSSDSATAASAAAASSTDAASPSYSLPSSHPGASFLPSGPWHRLEVTHTLTLFFLAQVFGHLKKRDLAAIYCHLCLNRQLKQRSDFNRAEWVTNAIGLSFYYSGRKLLKQAHHCLLAAQHFVREEDMPRRMNTPTTDTTKEQQLAADLCRAWGAFYLKWLQRSRDQFIESGDLLPIAPAEADKAVASDLAATLPTAAAAAAGTPAAAAASGSSASNSAVDDDSSGAIDPSTNLASLPAEELAELKRLQRMDRERERHFENQVEEEADEDEDDLFGDLRAPRHPDQPKEGDLEGAKKKVDRTQPSALTSEESEAVREELRKNVEDNAMHGDSSSTAASAAGSSSAAAASASASATPASAASSSSSGSTRSTELLIEFRSLNLPPSPSCAYATTFVAARALFKQSMEWFTRASYFYLLDGYVSDHIPIVQDMSLLYKLLSVFDMDLSRQCKMHKRRIDLLAPIYKQLSLASYQEYFQQLTDELAATTADMMDLKLFILHMKVKLLGPRFPAKKRDEAQAKVNELALKAVQYYMIWLQSWSKDGKEVEQLDEYYHRWYLMAMFKIARCYSKIYHSDIQVLNQFIKKSLDAYKAVVAKAEAWNAESAMPEELALCREMIKLLPYKMDRVVAKGGFRV